MRHLTTYQLFEMIGGTLSEEDLSKLEEHLNECAECQQEIQLIRLLEEDLRSVESPEMTPDFANRVIQRLNSKENSKIFDKRPFRLFKLALPLSFGLSFIWIWKLLLPIQVSLPSFEFPGLPYYFMAGACLVAFYILEKFLRGRQIKYT